MNHNIVLNNLQRRNNSLKSQLIHEQLKSGNYSSENFKKYNLIVIKEYKKHKSFFKVASILGITQKEIMNWYIQGQMGNLKFRSFYLAIKDINTENLEENTEEIVQDNEINSNDDGDYVISPYGDGWSYKTYIDGEKVFLISNELETLKKKVRDKHLPID
jgi:hypothetical protein